MSSRSINDLTSWEQGELSLEALSARHEDADPAGTIALHHTFTQMTAHEVAPPNAQQVESLLARLPERAVRGGVLSALQTSASRKVLAVLTSVLMSGGVAYAAGYTPVKERVDSVLRGITSLFDGSKGDGDRKSSDGDPFGEPAGVGGSGMVGGSLGNETIPGSTGTGQHDGSPGTNPSGDDSPEGDDETGDDATPDDHEGDGGTDDGKGGDDKGDDTTPDGDDVDKPDPDDSDDVDEPDVDDDTSADTDDDLNVDDDISEDNGADDPDDDAGGGGDLPGLRVSERSETR